MINLIRTRDLCVANAALSQLSYIPINPAARLLYSDSRSLSSISSFLLLSTAGALSGPPCGSVRDHLLGCLRKEGISTLSCLVLEELPVLAGLDAAGLEDCALFFGAEL